MLRILNSGVGTYNRQFTSPPPPHTHTQTQEYFWCTIYIHKEWTFCEAILSEQDQWVMHKLVEVCPESILHIQSCKFNYAWWVSSLVAIYCSLDLRTCRLLLHTWSRCWFDLGCFRPLRLRFATICLWLVYIPKGGYNHSNGSYCVPVTQLYKYCVCDQEEDKWKSKVFWI